MSSRAERAETSSRPMIAGIPPGIWVGRYYRWRLDVALAGRPTLSLGAARKIVPRAERSMLPALADKALDEIDVPAYIDLLREETIARGVPDGLRLAERRPVRLRAAPPQHQPLAIRVAKPAAQRPPKLGELLRHDGADFVRNAYLAVLNREPDWGGLANYLGQLNGRTADKVAILRALSSSPEGRKRGRSVRGLAVWTLYYRVTRRPLSQYGRYVLRRLARAPQQTPGGARPTADQAASPVE